MTTVHQRLALRLLNDADGLVDTHQMRLKLTIASGGKREWTYGQTHAMLTRMHKGGLVTRWRPRDGAVSRWTITPAGKAHLPSLMDAGD